MKRLKTWMAAALLSAAPAAHAEIRVAVEHNNNDAATPAFQFKTLHALPAPNAATTATFSIVDGTADFNGGGLEKLHDGRLPEEEDQPAENFFFQAGTSGGRLLVDLGTNIDIKQVSTYSWHPGARGPQVYAFYASDGSAGDFNARPQKGVDPKHCGWKQIADVNTVPKDRAEDGGQYAVSIADSNGVIGRYRYLLFDVASTENEDAFGNTFYSEISVIDANAPATAKANEVIEYAAPFVFKTADGHCEITLQAKDAPQLQSWATNTLAPALAEWYPKIVAMLPSDGFTAPKHFSITLKPMDGVAYTAGTRVMANSGWLEHEIGREAVGSLVHELVHVVQQFGRGGARNPGWLVEGSADYIRWFKYEPQSHGADLVWMKQLRRFTPRYDASYRVTANFLQWVSEKYDADIVRQMNAAMRDGNYRDDLWKQYTGKSAAELGDEWQKAVELQLANK